MILILTAPHDEHADHVEKKLRERDANVVRWNPAQFPCASSISIHYAPHGRREIRWESGGQGFEFSEVNAIWYRHPEPTMPHADVKDVTVGEYVVAESKSYLKDVWNCLECMWLPGPLSVIERAQFKAFQLGVAARLGFELPPTLFTNSPDEFLDFYRAHNGKIVSKLTGIAFQECAGLNFNRYTQVVSKRDVGYFSSVRHAPVIFQAYVPKRLELRITVVGDKVFAAEIHSQHSHHTRHDWRRYDLNQTPHFAHELPAELQVRCVQLVRELGLCYGALDMVLTPDGRYVFLEINPGGQYLWIEALTGLPISDAICELLIAGNPSHQLQDFPQPHQSKTNQDLVAAEVTRLGSKETIKNEVNHE